MSSQQHRGLAQVMDRYTNDPSFKQQLRQNPEEAVRRAGIQLEGDEQMAFRQLDWTLPDEQLQERVSKMGLPGLTPE